MKAKDKTTGQFKKVYVKALDGMPVGSEIDYSGNISDIPTGWEVVNDNVKILWTNPNPTSAMSSGTTIDLSSSDYDILEIFYITHVSNERNIKSIRALKSFDIDLEVINEAGTPYTRKISRTNDTSYSAGGGYTYTSYGGGKTLTANVCVPLYIVGYKTGLFN